MIVKRRRRCTTGGLRAGYDRYRAPCYGLRDTNGGRAADRRAVIFQGLTCTVWYNSGIKELTVQPGGCRRPALFAGFWGQKIVLDMA